MGNLSVDNLAQLVQDCIDGNESGLKAFAILREQKAFIEDCMKEIESLAYDEAESYGEKKFNDHGFSFEIRSGGAMYDFKECPNWIEKKAELKSLEDMLKAALKSRELGGTTVDENGEVLSLPTVTHRKDSIVIKKA
jgi:hypothetical protein